MPALTAKQRLKLLEKVFKQGKSVASACQEFGVSRFTFYKWAKKYDPKASRKINLGNLRDQKRKIKKFAGQAPTEVEEEVKRIAAQSPDLSKYKIAEQLKKRLGEKAVGVHGVYNILKRAGLATPEQREQWKQFIFNTKRRKLTPQLRLEILRRAEELNIPVAQVCRDFGISRFTFYKWKDRWEKSGRKLDALSDRKPGYDRKHFRVQPEHEQAILSIVIEYPNLSKYGITKKLSERIGPVVGVHGVYNVLLRNRLNRPENRLAYSRVHAPEVPAPLGWLDRVRYVLEQFVPSLAPAPPPVLSTIFNFFRTFSIASIISSATVYSIIWWINYLTSLITPSAIGTIFATIALLMGSIFFLYSFKYYLTLAIVLSFSQQETETGINGNGNGKKRGLLSWILGLNGGDGNGPQTRQTSGPVGLTPNLEHISLKSKPYISIHIPFYNEKNVVERAMEAATNFDYPEYEVIFCDDSTDDTTTIIKNYIKNNGVAPRSFSGVGWTLTQAEVRPGVTLKHLHRTSRSGFKGGALKLALTLTDPRAEFISVFDADFVPYPDTLELFLKYFKVQNNMSEDYQDSNVAAVAGYQWHVLNKSENWITRGIRSEYAGSYVIERSGQEILGTMKLIHGSVYMVRRKPLEEVGWETSITEDFQLTLKLYEKGYKVVYTPYIQAPAECVSTLKRLIRQRMRWAEGHSNNVRKMFIRLLFGRWELSQPINHSTIKPSSHSGENSQMIKWSDGQKKFVPSPLTLSEKLEFLYLSPYYLQAFFFLVGTISWLISETIFPARLPFWTDLWGWSLVLTNLFALPLMNAVGLFLEESEEKDYQGIFSFIALSYIVVPFQAYASLKGFLKGEGPWFRTPKTGHITDIITRGRFYRFISGILPGRQPAVARQGIATRVQGLGIPSLNPKPYTLNPYLALSTANSRFNNFTIRNRKGRRWIGKLMVTTLLIISTTITRFAPYIPVDNDPQIPGPAAGHILAPEEVKLTPEQEKNLEEAINKNSSLPQINIIKEAKASTADIENTIDTGFVIKTKGLQLKGERNSFTALEDPVFEVKQTKNVGQKIGDFFFKIIGIKKSITNSKVKVRVIDLKGNEINNIEVYEEESGKLKVIVHRPTELDPGEYSIIVQNDKGNGLIQDFTWGVLVVNTNKSIYLPGETAKLAMSVLDETGNMVCSAHLRLTITDPEGNKAFLSTSDQSIKINDECLSTAVTLVPDYEASFTVGNPGRYQMNLFAITGNGEYEVNDIFEVREAVEYDIERIATTRLYPRNEYPVIFKVKANQDYSGFIEEPISEKLEPFELSEEEVRKYLGQEVNTNGIQEQLELRSSLGKKVLRWFVDWQEGKTYYFGYKIKAPITSPEFYLLGPLWIGGFKEARMWQLAGDAADDLILLWDRENYGAIPGSWTSLSESPSGTYYQKFIRGAGTAGGTAGSTNHTHTVTTGVSTVNATQKKGNQTQDLSEGHTHTETTNVDGGATTNNNPQFRELVLIRYTGIPSSIPQNAIALFDAAPASGSWSRYSTQDAYYIYGADKDDTTMDTGGNTSNQHSHTVTVDLDTGGGAAQKRGNNAGTTCVQTGHDHTVSDQTTNTATYQPPYVDTLLYRNTASGTDVIPVGMIGMFDAAAPTNWDSISGTGGAFENKFIKPASTYGGTGGGGTHTHNDITGVASGSEDLPLSDCTEGSGTNLVETHTHTIDLTSFETKSESDMLPEYVNTVIAKYNPPTIDVTGDCKQYNQSTNCTDSQTVKIAYGNTLRPDSTTTGSGTFTFSSIVAPNSGDIVTVFLDGVADANEAVAVTEYDGSGNITGLRLYEEHLTIGSADTAFTITNSELGSYDNDRDNDLVEDEEDIFFDVDSANDLTVDATSQSTQETLHIQSSTLTYRPDSASSGNIATHDLEINNSATLTADGNSITVSGSWENTSVFNDDTSTVTFTATAGTESIDNSSATTHTFNILTLGSGSGTAEWDMSGDLDVDGTFNITYGTLDMNGANNINVAAAMTISANGAFTKGSGTFTFDGTGSNNYTDSTAAIQNLGDVTIDAESGTRTVSLQTDMEMDNLTIAADGVFTMSTHDVTIGNTTDASHGDVNVATGGSSSQSATGTVTILSNSGTTQWNGPGDFDAYNLTLGDGTTSFTINNEANDLGLDIANDFTLASGASTATFQASSTADFFIGGSFANNGIFTANQGTVTMDDNALDPAETLSGTMTGSSSFYNLTFNDGGSSGVWSFSASATVTYDFKILGGSVTAPSGTLSVGHDFDNDDTFANNSGTVVLSGSVDTTQTITSTATITFNNLTANTGDRIIKFESSRIFEVDGALTINATENDCEKLLVIRATTDGTAFTFQNDGTETLAYVDFQDTTFSSAASASNSVDSDNNSNVTIAANACIGASQDASNKATGYSFQRKTFWDSANERYWLFYHDGTHIEVRYSSNDGSTWNVDDDTLAYDTNDFSVWWGSISSVEYVWLAVTSSNDILVRRGTLTGSDVSWDTDVVTAMADQGGGDSYSYPYISLDSSNYLWVGARYYDGTNYTYQAVRSDDGDTGGATWDSNFQFGNTIAEAQLSDDQTNTNVYGNIVPLASQDMYATFVVDTALEGCMWDHTPDARWEDSNDTACSPTTGGGGEYELRDSDGPNKIDDAGNPGAMPGAGRQIVQTSRDTLYAAIFDTGSLEIWMSVDGGSWTEQDDGNNPSAGDGIPTHSIAIDNTDTIHLSYVQDGDLQHNTFNTSTNTFGSAYEILTGTYSSPILALDSNNAPHIFYYNDTSLRYEYVNKTGGSWNTAVTVQSIAERFHDITIDDDDLPELVIVESGDWDLRAFVGNNNNATSFTPHDVDTDINSVDGERGCSIAIDQAGNTWIAYIDNDVGGVGNDYVSLAKRTDGNETTQWTTGWTSAISNTNLGYEPSIAIVTSDIYVFYQDDESNKRIVYDRYNSAGSTWLNETALETPSGVDYQDVHARWS